MNDIVQLMIRTAPPPADDINNGKKETKKSENKGSCDSLVNGHVSNDDEVHLQEKKIIFVIKGLI